MFDSTFSFTTDAKEYNLILRRDDNWKQSSQRVLILLQTVPTSCLKEQDILPRGLVRTTLVNLIKMSKEHLKSYGGKASGAAFAVANFNAFRHMHLKGQGRYEAESEFAQRAKKLIKKLRPTHVLVCGDVAASRLIDVDNVAIKRGWVHKQDNIRYVNTLDINKLLEKKGALANLLGFVMRHLTYLLLGRHPHNLAHVKAQPRFIKTLKEFDQMMARLYKLTPDQQLALDTEDRNLSVNANSIYTIQFATSENPDIGYVVPLRHPRTHFSAEDVKYMRKALKKFFSRREGPELVTFNGMFDLRVLRTDFKLPIIYNKVWEIMAGEHDLDENIGSLHLAGPRMGGLAQVYCAYGNDHYYKASFSKEDRTTTGTIAPDDPHFCEYAATDVVSIMHIRQAQIDRASHEIIDGKPYRKKFIKHMRYIMSDTVHSLSHLKQDGSFVDRDYIEYLLSSDSPMRAEIKAIEKKLRDTKAGQAANAALLHQSGMKAGSLFGGSGSQWMLKLSKSAHKAKLFFEELGLEPVSETKAGEPAIDKHFIKAYKNSVPEVSILDEWSKMTKLLGTYVRGWNKILNTDIDSVKDSYLRPDYSFWDVSTGRLASKRPSLQTIPSRGSTAKMIKKMFLAPFGRLLLRFDFSAHEVRMWSVISGDKKLAQSFKTGQELRRKLIAEKSAKILEDIRNELKTKGDIHIINVHRFFDRWVTKDDPLRDAIKQVIFGLLYGKSAKTLGEDIRANDTTHVSKKILALKAEREALLQSL